MVLSHLEEIVGGFAIATTVGVSILAFNATIMSAYASHYNRRTLKSFLKKEFGKKEARKVEVLSRQPDPKHQEIMRTTLRYNNAVYTLISMHQKYKEFVDYFEDARLYRPLRLIKREAA